MEQFTATVNGRGYTFDEYMVIPPNVVAMLKRNVYVSNGCGTNWFNRMLIGWLESWAKTELVKCCIVHDCSYDTGNGTVPDKIMCDSDLHINVYNMIVYNGGSLKRARAVARLFHMAVIYGGGRSYKLNTDGTID